MSFASIAHATETDHGGVELADARTITVTATRLPQPVSDVPATVSVIDSEKMADDLVSDVKDLVRFEPGVSVQRSPTRFGAAQGATGRNGNAGFNIRGLDGNRVLIQVDGVRVPDGFDFGAESMGRGDYADLSLIKSVEILRGPASALYGSDGLAGAVSFVTADPEDFLGKSRNVGGMVRAGYDSSDRKFSESGIVATRFGNWSAIIAYTRRDGHEQETHGSNASANSNRTEANPQDTASNAVLGKIVWAPSDAHRVRLTLDHLDSRVNTDVLTGIAPVPSAATSVIGLTARDTIKRDRVTLDWRYTGEGMIDLAQVAAWYQNSHNRQYTAEDRNTALDRTRYNTFDNRVIGASAELHSRLTTGPIAHRFVYGGDVSVTRQQGIRGGTVPTPPDVFPTRAFPITDYTLVGGYLADEMVAGPLSIFPVLRFDHYSLTPKQDALMPAFQSAKQSGSHVSPKIGAVLKLGGGFSAFANYAQGFKAPAPSQVNQFFQNLNQGYTSIPNPNLRPETSKTIEGGLRTNTRYVDASITGFSGRYRHFISQQTVGGTGAPGDPIIFQFINLNRVKISGVEGKLEGRSDQGITGTLAISYTKGDTINLDGSRSPLLSIDPLKLVVGLGYRDPAGRFGGQLIMTHSDAKSADRTTGGCTTTCLLSGAFTILDAAAFVHLNNTFTLRAGIFNLLDTKYTWWSDVRGISATTANLNVADSYTQPGRNVSVSLTARF